MAIWIWLVVAVVAAIGEAVTYDLFLASVAAAAIVAGLLSGVLPLALQVGVFAGVSLVSIGFFRPAIKHALGIDSMSREANTVRHQHVTGRRATVVRTVDGNGGQVRIGQGEFWSARAYEPGQIIAEGQTVDVVLVEGLTALVEPIQPPALETAVGSVSSEAPIQKGN